MSSDPRAPPDDGDPEEARRTRLVMHAEAASAAVPVGAAVIGRTRLVGSFDIARALSPAPLARTSLVRDTGIDAEPVAGWIVVVKGPGRGAYRPVYVGMNALGRAPNQRIPVDFGDESISREEHAVITYDEETRTFYLQHGGKANLVRLGGKPVLVPTELKAGNLFRIGNTTFRFVAFCGRDFDWTSEVEDA
ncbi:FHA domain-containing protein [Hyphomicrobium sp. CS1GBMeth3]|uniref:FHA domain-containing protein n=1 Tax=Hyphomicrobium sp. CS1GBMeth3 TaxID=1892845 RepID=UPI000931A7F0|nr:FHA domain-containing protein [Hyphomicrobium sp. CS1GBMeth3]